MRKVFLCLAEVLNQDGSMLEAMLSPWSSETPDVGAFAPHKTENIGPLIHRPDLVKL